MIRAIHLLTRAAQMRPCWSDGNEFTATSHWGGC